MEDREINKLRYLAFPIITHPNNYKEIINVVRNIKIAPLSKECSNAIDVLETHLEKYFPNYDKKSSILLLNKIADDFLAETKDNLKEVGRSLSHALEYSKLRDAK